MRVTCEVLKGCQAELVTQSGDNSSGKLTKFTKTVMCVDIWYESCFQDKMFLFLLVSETCLPVNTLSSLSFLSPPSTQFTIL